MQLVIAEKPSVARNIAKVLHATNVKDGYLEGKEYLVSWCIGHLIELASADQYRDDWKAWKYETLPMIPENWKYQIKESTKGQFRVLKELLHRADITEVICATDLEQQEGRILRQGNQNDKVKIFRYVTENTFDAYMWQILENKQKFISQIMTSKSPVRACEDVDDTALSYAEIKALATGNPYIKEKMDLDVQVSKLKLLKANHTSQIYRLESDIAKNFPVQISALKERIAGMQIDSQVVKSVDLQDNDTFAMTVGNVLYEDKKEAGEALIAACAGLKTVSTGGKVGEYHGFTLSASYNMFSNAFELTVKGKCSYKLEIGKDPVGNMQRIHNTLSSIDRKLTESEQKLETVQQQLATAQEEVKKPFPKEAELNEKMERLSELNALLNMDEKGNETIMADEDIGREGSSTDSRDAVEEKELPETADRIHKPSILERLKQEKAQQNTAEQPPVQKTAKKKHEQEL